jgi:hypothetical protein
MVTQLTALNIKENIYFVYNSPAYLKKVIKSRFPTVKKKMATQTYENWSIFLVIKWL